jgi:hypothetical protein
MALVTAVLGLRMAVSRVRMARLASSAARADADWVVLVDEVRSILGVSRPVPVRVTGAMSVPAVAGVLRPILLLPLEAGEWAADVRRAVALHELAHVARRDALSQLVGQVACACYWFVPLVWHGARRASAMRERASDDAVIRAGVQPSTYAENLIALARSASAAPLLPATVAMAQVSRMRERVVAILDPHVARERVSWRSVMAVLLLILGATAAIGAIEPTERAIAFLPVSNDMPVAVPVAPGKAGARSAASAPVSQTAQTSDRLCGGRGLDQSSSSIHEDGSTRRWTVRLSGRDCSVDLRAEGQFEFNADFTDISRITSNGFFRVDVTDRGVRRQIEIESRGGTLTRSWRVDGRERPYDTEARAWFAAFLIELDRRTAIGVDVRLPHLMRQGGVDAVLKETELMPSDYARSQYYTRLARAAKLTAAETTRLLRQAGTLTKSSYYSAELVKAFAGPGVQDATVRAALVELVDKMDSDYYRATSIEAIVGSGAPGAAEMDLLLRVIPRMTSDHYKTEVLTKVLRGPLTADQQVTIARAAATIESDHYATQVLKTLANAGFKGESVRTTFLDAVGKIGSDHYRGESLAAFLAVPTVGERDLVDAVASVKSMDSDYYKSQTLERIARHRAATERVRSAVLDASAGLSRHYADQVRRAVGK